MFSLASEEAHRHEMPLQHWE